MLLLNPFVELFNDPVWFLGALAYIALLGAITIQLAARGWETAVWLGNAWEWRHQDTQFGGEWTWYLPPSEVYNRITLLAFLIALECLAIGGVLYALGAVA